MGRNQFARILKRAVGSSIVCLGLSLTVCVSPAEERVDGESQGIIESLMRRSAEERWQSVKRRYPLDNSSGSASETSKTVAEKSGVLGDDLVPPSPEESPLSMHTRNPDDWVLPARPLNGVDGAQLTTSEEGDIEIGVPSEARSSRTFPNGTKRLAARQTEATQPTEDAARDEKARGEQSLVRKMGDIVPFYDRDRDDDIRDFAVEKAKDYGIAAGPRPYHDRMFPQLAMNWEASNLWYRPLYFSDPALERYGHTHHPFVQPFVSIARFGTQFCFMPYQLTIEPPCVEVSPLGWYRPGDCVPKLCYPVPLNAEAAAVQAGYVTGLYFLIP